MCFEYEYNTNYQNKINKSGFLKNTLKQEEYDKFKWSVPEK